MLPIHCWCCHYHCLQCQFDVEPFIAAEVPGALSGRFGMDEHLAPWWAQWGGINVERVGEVFPGTQLSEEVDGELGMEEQ